MVLVTGAAGQLGSTLMKTRVASARVVGLDRRALNIEDPHSIDAALKRYKPTAIINAAAFTNVDKAESESARAFAINADGVRNLAVAAVAARARLIHVSTDYVFDGAQRTPYTPDDRTNPLNVYGASKLAGERAFADCGVEGAVIRASWIFSAERTGFIAVLLSLLRGGKTLRFVSDQVGVPTSALELAPVLIQAACEPGVNGLFHWTNAGSCTRFDQAVAAQQFALERGLIKEPVEIVPVASAEFPAAARRPAYSVLDATGLWRHYGTPVDWRRALEKAVAMIE